jgi:hypothetical protein
LTPVKPAILTKPDNHFHGEERLLKNLSRQFPSVDFSHKKFTTFSALNEYQQFIQRQTYSPHQPPH